MCVSLTRQYGSSQGERRVCMLECSARDCKKFYLTNTKESRVNEPLGDGMLFVNAWNKWTRGAHLETDERNGYA